MVLLFVISQNCIHFRPLCPHVAHDFKLLFLKDYDRSVKLFKKNWISFIFLPLCHPIHLNHPNQKFEISLKKLLWPLVGTLGHRPSVILPINILAVFPALEVSGFAGKLRFFVIFPWVLTKFLNFWKLCSFFEQNVLI